MRRLRKFLYLSLEDKILFFKAVVLVGAFRISLLIFPLKLVQQFVDSVTQKLSKPKTNPQEKISWCIKTVGNYLLGPESCLPVALAAKVLLKQNGYPATINIGVYKDNEIKLEAHAWVESEGKIIVGEATIKDYTPLLTIKKKNLSRSTIS